MFNGSFVSYLIIGIAQYQISGSPNLEIKHTGNFSANRGNMYKLLNGLFVGCVRLIKYTTRP